MTKDKSAELKPGEWKKAKEHRGTFKRGSKFYIRFADATGKVITESTGSPSRAFATKVLEKRRTEVRENRYFPKVKEVLVDEIIEDAIAAAKASHELSYPHKKFRSYRYRIAGSWFKGKVASSLTMDDIAAKLSEHCETPANFNRYRVALSHAYKLAVKKGKVSVNPASQVDMKKENNERVRFLNQFDQKEEKSIREATRAKWPDREADFDLALHTGMRWEEQYTLLWNQVDLKRKQITVLAGKGNKRRHIPISAKAEAALTKLKPLATNGLVCPDAKHHRDFWDGVRLDAKVVDLKWHDLRHTFATRWVEAGNDLYDLKQILGHGSIRQTEKYAHHKPNRLAAAFERLDKLETEGVSGSDTTAFLPPTTDVRNIHKM